jgi:hypothetical protein
VFRSRLDSIRLNLAASDYNFLPAMIQYYALVIFRALHGAVAIRCFETDDYARGTHQLYVHLCPWDGYGGKYGPVLYAIPLI